MADTELAPAFQDNSETNLKGSTAAGGLDATLPYTEVRLANGQMVELPTSLLIAAMQEQSAPERKPASSKEGQESSVVVPLVEERLAIGKREIATGSVRLRKSVQEYSQQLDERLAVRTFDIERVVLNRQVETAPPVRQEGNVTVYSLVEEQLVLTKQLILKEEVHVIQRDTERRDEQVVTLKKESLSVERESLV